MNLLDLKFNSSDPLDSYNIVNDGNYYIDGANHTAPVNWYKQNSVGICSVIGNVKEITFSRELFGGSYATERKDILEIEQYNKTSTMIGFRVILEIDNDK